MLLKFSAQVISGTVPAGPVWHAMFSANAVVAAKTGLIVGTYGNTGPGSVASDYANAASTALAGTGAPFIVRQSPINFSAGSYANLGGAAQSLENIDGDLIVPQGYGWCPQWSGAGTSVLNYYNLTWVEVPA